jgi:hypothetical protein
VPSWVTHDASIELPRKLNWSARKSPKRLVLGSHAIALLDLYSISRAEFELPETSARVRARCAAGVTRFCGGHLPGPKADDHLFDLPAQDPSFASAENWLRSGGSSARIDSYVLMYRLVDTSEAIYE